MERLQVCPASTLRQQSRHASPNPGASLKSQMKESVWECGTDTAARVSARHRCWWISTARLWARRFRL